MLITDFASLKQAITDTLDRPDLSAHVETFIQLAEDRNKDIRIREMLTRAQSNFSTRFLALPTNFLEMKSLGIVNKPFHIVEEVSLDQLNRFRSSSPGTPNYFTVHVEIEFDKTPDQTLTAEMIYYRATALSDANPTNVILTRAPGVYLYAALIAAEPFLANDERLETWAQLYASSRDSLNALDRKRSGPLVSRVHGATP